MFGGKHGGEAGLVDAGIHPLGVAGVGLEVAAQRGHRGRVGRARRVRRGRVAAVAEVRRVGFHLGEPDGVARPVDEGARR